MKIYRRLTQSILEYVLVVAAIVVLIIYGANYIRDVINLYMLPGATSKVEDQTGVLKDYIGVKSQSN